VQRLARSPFKAKIRVRFPLAVPNLSSPKSRSDSLSDILNIHTE
jgi:hypothetical protein